MRLQIQCVSVGQHVRHRFRHFAPVLTLALYVEMCLFNFCPDRARHLLFLPPVLISLINSTYRAPLSGPRWTESHAALIFLLHTLPANQLRHVVRAQMVDEILTLSVAPFAVAKNLAFHD